MGSIEPWINIVISKKAVSFCCKFWLYKLIKYQVIIGTSKFIKLIKTNLKNSFNVPPIKSNLNIYFLDKKYAKTTPRKKATTFVIYVLVGKLKKANK